MAVTRSLVYLAPTVLKMNDAALTYVIVLGVVVMLADPSSRFRKAKD